MSQDEAVKELYNKIQYKTNFREKMRFMWWCIFKKYKVLALDDGFKSGLSARQSFELAEQAEESYTHTGGRAKTTTAWRRVLKNRQ